MNLFPDAAYLRAKVRIFSGKGGKHVRFFVNSQPKQPGGLSRVPCQGSGAGGKSGQQRAFRFLTGSSPRGLTSAEENNRRPIHGRQG